MWAGRLRLDRTLKHVRRYRHIVGVLTKYGFEELSDTLSRKLVPLLGARARPSKVRRAAEGRSRPARVRMALEELGPTFVKLGQLLSTRPDLVAPEYIEELERLQDQVPAEKFPRIRAEVEAQLHGKLERLFRSFEPAPIAAGSIGQVHRAVTADGRQVVVKVRRPGIVQTLRTECEILDNLAALAKAALGQDDTIDPQRLVREFTEAVEREADFAAERRNQQRFRRNFAGDPTVHIPAVHEDLCSEGVLTMEYIEGIKPSDAGVLVEAGLDPKVLATRGTNFVLKQIFRFGFFHTDPHPGNFFILPDNVLATIDFGQVGRLTPQDRQLLTDLTLSIVDRDVIRLVHALRRADMLADETDPARLARDIEDLLDTYYNMPLKEIPFRQALRQGFDLIRGHHIRPPAQLTLMTKCLMTIESFAIEMDNDFQIIRYIKPYARQLAREQFSPRRMLRNLRKALRDAAELAAALPEDVNSIVGRFRRGQFQLRIHHEHLENLVRTLDRSSNRISFALIIAALLVASSLLVAQEGLVFRLIHYQTLGIIGYTFAAVLGVWLLISILRGRHF